MARCMDMPELRTLLSRHLDRNDLLNACRVCKAWYQDFKPALWRHYTINWRESDEHVYERFDDSCPVVTNLRQNVRHIRSVHFPYQYDMVEDLSHLIQVLVDGCRNQLVELEVAATKDEHWAQFTQLCHNNAHTITQLQWPMDVYGTVEQRYTMLRALPNLQSLHICFEYESPLVNIMPLLQVLASLDKLERLSLKGWHSYKDLVPDLGITPNTPRPVLQHLKELTLDDSCLTPHTLELLRRCPNLEILTLNPDLPNSNLNDSSERDTLLHTVAQIIKDYMPCLRTLSLGEKWSGEDEPLEILLESLAPPTIDNEKGKWIQHLIVNADHMMSQTVVDAIAAQEEQEHQSPLDLNVDIGSTCLGANLVSLRLAMIEWDVSIAPIFRVCSNLKTFILEDTWSKLTEDLTAEAWMCTQLEVLHLAVVMQDDGEGGDGGSTGRGSSSSLSRSSTLWPTLAPRPRQTHRTIALERAFLGRVGALVNLRELRLGHENSLRLRYIGQIQCLLMRQETGLEQLMNLKQLWHLDLGKAPYEQGIEELEWMHQHWPRLLALTCERVRAVELYWLAEHWADLRLKQLRSF
ncbi:hypothetical protein BGW42_001656 [Actinomortierella wolfii]|nr:hypothetical protein BGW42_001656 [Actinomortierella wolfii]